MPGASLSLSFLAPPRTGSLATAAAANPLARRASGVGLGSLLQSNQGGGVMVGGQKAGASDVFLPLDGSMGYAPNGGVGSSLGPPAVAAQAKAVAKARRERRQRGQW